MEKKTKWNPALVLLIGTNLLPFFGILFAGWEPKGIFVLYIIETMIVGLGNVFKMLAVYLYKGEDKAGEGPAALSGMNKREGVKGLGLVPFFMVHYFMFVFIQGTIFFAFTGLETGNKGPAGLFNLFAQLEPYFRGEYGLAVAALSLGHIIYLISEFMIPGVYKTATMSGLMFSPYKRIILQQITVIGGGFIFMMLGSSRAFAAFFIFLKLGLDLLVYGRKRPGGLAKKLLGKIYSEEEQKQIDDLFNMK